MPAGIVADLFTDADPGEALPDRRIIVAILSHAKRGQVRAISERIPASLPPGTRPMLLLNMKPSAR